MIEAHEQKHTLIEFVEYGEHADRTTSAEFRHNSRILVRQLDLPCWICGSRDHREVHHIHEWSLWNSLDPEKVLDTLHVFDPYGFTHKIGEQPILTPDDIRNLLVLCGHCDIAGIGVPGGHHRGIDAGAHDLTFPIWVAQRAVKPGLSITRAIQHVKGKDADIVAAKSDGS
jgi:hypothetical protein